MMMSVGFIRTLVAKALRVSALTFIGEEQPDGQHVAIEPPQV